MSDDTEEPRGGAGPDAGEDHGDLRLRDEPDRSGSWYSTYGGPLFRIVILVALLVALVVLRKPCADGVAGFVGNFGQPGSQAGPRDGGARGAPGDAAPRH